MCQRHAAIIRLIANATEGNAACSLVKQQHGGQELRQQLNSIHQLWSYKHKDDAIWRHGLEVICTGLQYLCCRLLKVPLLSTRHSTTNCAA